MSIPTQISLQGFIASAPQLNQTDGGVARFYARVGVEHFRHEADGSFTKLDPTFHDLVMFRKSAERAYAQYRVGDAFVASGYIHEYDIDHNGLTQTREEFVAKRIGHDTARTRYEIDRTPSRQPDPPSDQLTATSQLAHVIGL